MMLGVQVAHIDEWSVVRVVGDIDMATAPRLRQALVAEIREGRAQVVVDLSGVDFADSTGLGVLVSGLVRARRLGGDLRVTGLSGRLADLFDLVGLRALLAEPDASMPEGVVATLEGDPR